MDEVTITSATKILRFARGEKIKVSIELENITNEQNKKINDFLETMFKEIKELL